MSDPYTDGPWEIVPYGDGDSLVIEAITINGRICFMATPGTSPRAMARILANARLISAAPELLAAARDGLAYMESELELTLEGHCLLNPDLTPRRETLDACLKPQIEALERKIALAGAAIAKATGGAA
jgi:hypothetical protein